MRHQAIRFVVGLGLSAAACTSSSVPVSTIAATEGSIRAAQVAGAEQYPQAALHLHYAREQRAEAQSLLEQGHGDAAQLAFRRAQADADLAYALARAATAQGTRAIGGGVPSSSSGSP